MKKNSIWDGIALALLMLLLAALIALVAFGATGSGREGRELPLGQCYSPEEGLEFCNIGWYENISYVAVFQGDKEDLLLVLTLQTVDSHGYSLTSSGLSVYVESAAR